MENGAVGNIMLEISRSASPVFFISTGETDDPFGNMKFEAVTISRFATGNPTPVPDRFTTTSGVSGALLVIVNVPANCPCVGGWN